MSTTSKERNLKLIALLGLIIPFVQLLLPTFPGIGPHSLTLWSAILLWSLTAITLFRQWVSNQILDKAAVPTILVGVISLIGGFNDVLDVIKFSEHTDQIIRFSLTVLVGLLGLVSKLLWPTDTTKQSLL